MNEGLTKYKITIDPDYAEGDEDLGLDMIAFVKTPAIQVKGMAFTAHQPFRFKDDIKMRIAAPALIPMDIYRNDDMGEYYVQFTTDEIERIFVKFMSQLNNRDKFNLEHDENKISPAFILEAWLVGKDPQRDRSYSEFGIAVPTGTLFMVAQITDRAYYDTLINNEQTGFSIEGFLGLKFDDQIKKLRQSENLKSKSANNKKVKTMKKSLKRFAGKTRFSGLKFEDGKLVEGGEITVVAEELTPEADALVIDENLEVIDDYTGEIYVDDSKVVIEDGVISEVIAEEPQTENEKKDLGIDVQPGAKAGANPEPEKKKEGMTDKEKEMPAYAKKGKMEDKEEEKAVMETVEEEITEEVAMAIDETELMTILQPKFDEIYKLVADLKIEIDALKPAEEVIEELPVTLSTTQRLAHALQFNK